MEDKTWEAGAQSENPMDLLISQNQADTTSQSQAMLPAI